MKRKLILTTAGALFLLAQSSAFADGNGQRRPDLEGLWMVEITLRDCATGAVAPVPNPVFPTLNTFHKGGTLSEHGARFSPATRGSGHGIWKRTGARTYEFRLIFQLFDVNGFHTGDQDVVTQLTLSHDGNTSAGTAQVTINRIGLPPIQGCATSVGQRVEL